MTHPRELIARAAGALRAAAARSRVPARRARAGSTSSSSARACEQRVAIVDWLAERYRAGAAVRRLHGRRPHPPPRLARLGGARPRQQRRRGLPDPRRARSASCLSALGDETNVLVVSDHGGGSLEGVVNLNAWLAQEGYLAYAASGDGDGASSAHQLFELRRKLPEASCATRSSSACPGCASAPTGCRRRRVVDWARTRAFSYGIFGNIVLNVRGRERARHRRARRGVRARCATSDRRAAARAALARRRADRRRRAPARGSLRRAAARRDPRPDRRVPRLRVARQGEPHGAHADDLGRRSRSGAARPGSLRRQPPPGGHRRARRAGGARRAPSCTPGSPTSRRPMLYLLGEPIPADLEGRLLDGGDRPGAARRAAAGVRRRRELEVGAATPYDARARAEVEERLRSLGYLE